MQGWFTAVLFQKQKTGNGLKCLLNKDWLSELSYIHTMKHYTDVTKNVKHEFTQKAPQDIFSKKKNAR